MKDKVRREGEREGGVREGGREGVKREEEGGLIHVVLSPSFTLSCVQCNVGKCFSVLCNGLLYTEYTHVHKQNCN